MKYTADYLIQQRKNIWNEKHDIEYDKELREAIAQEIVNNKELLDELRQYPEKLIELVFVVVDKNQQTMPFFLNDVQQEFINTLNQAKKDFVDDKITEISLLILKGRQQGFTTVVTAYQLSSSILNKNFQGFTLADKSDNSEAIFQNKAKFPYGQLPNILQPTEKFNNRKQFLFEKINSSWAVDTATKDVGRSRTVNFFHGSECAFWKDGIAPIQAALGEAFTKNCIKIYESTANGYNDYQIMWESGNHINCFYEWWKTKEYRLNFPDEESKREFIAKMEQGKDWISKRLLYLRDDKKIDNEQLYWYFKKYEGYIDKDLIKQEYPCSPDEAFLLSGTNVFDTEQILSRLANLSKPLKTGFFIYDYDGQRITNIKWQNDSNGYIKIYELPNTPEITKYCIGGDTAGDGSDYFTGHVINAKTGNQAAVLKKQFDADLYTKQMYCLGVYYSTKDVRSPIKEALIGIEANFDSFPIRELQRLKYKNQYVREKIDDYTKATTKNYGFRTTSLTRPTIISNLVQIVREDVDKINDEDTLRELLKIIKNDKGRIEAPPGGHDDQMMGLAIAHEIRHTVIFTKDTIHVPSQTHFNIEKTMDNTFEQITVV